LGRNVILAEFRILDGNWEVQGSTFDQETKPDTGLVHSECRGDKESNGNVFPHCVNSVDVLSHTYDKFSSYFDFTDTNLTVDQKVELQKCLYDHRSVFVTEESPDLGFTDLVQHRIHLKANAQSKHIHPYRLPPHKREVLRHQLDELLRQGIIVPVEQPGSLPITSPIVLVSKRKTKGDFIPGSREESLALYRFCLDFRHLNSQTEDFHYRIPDLQELTEFFSDRKPRYITSLDVSQSFFQMGIDPDSSPYTAFNSCFGTFCFRRLPMGLKTAASSFQLLMDKVLHGLTFRSVLCYLDDVCVISESYEQHLADLKEVLGRFRDVGLKLGPKKCAFAQQRCEF